MAEPRIVTCTRCGETKTGLPRAPLSGDIGQQVLEHVCQDCWNDWFEQSVAVINHYGLNPAVREDRQQLYEVMREFLQISDAL